MSSEDQKPVPEPTTTSTSVRVIENKYAFYPPLNASRKEIRLITVLPGRQGSTVICLFNIASLLRGHIHSYESLSYCWGDLNDLKMIDIIHPLSPKVFDRIRIPDGFDEVDIGDYLRPVTEEQGRPNIKALKYSFKVTANLEAALQHLRDEKVARTLWIDAICINQSDNSEKSVQVAMMRDIYARAGRTIIWLGEEAEYSRSAVELIKLWASIPYEDIVRDIDAFSNSVPQAWEKKAWDALSKLFKRPWWERVWTYQEYVVSSRATFLCGTDQVENRIFADATVSWTKLSKEIQNLNLDSQKTACLLESHYNFFIRLDIHRKYRHTSVEMKTKWTGPPIDLVSLQDRTHSYDSSDPRDKVYALLGVDEVQDVLVVPNYEKSVTEVYSDFTVEHIRSQSNLSILSFSGIGFSVAPEHLAMPSWVPDFRCSSLRGDSMSNMGFRASGRSLASFSFCDDMSMLRLNGVCYDVVTDLFHSSTSSKPHWSDFAAKYGVPHPTGISQLQAFFRTMIVDVSNSEQLDPYPEDKIKRKEFFDLAVGYMIYFGMDITLRLQNTGDLTPQMYENWRELTKHNSDYARGCSIFALGFSQSHEASDEDLLRPFLSNSKNLPGIHWPPDYQKEGNFSRHGLSYMQRMALYTKNQTFFASKRGYLGLGPRGAQVGDQICILLGCDLPFLIRTEGDFYVIVGVCYVYGIMHGEVFKDVEAGKVQIQPFSFI